MRSWESIGARGRARVRAVRCASALVFPWILAGFQRAPAVEELGARDPATAERAFARASAEADRALEGCAGLSAHERRMRAELVRAAGGERSVGAALAHLDDPDAQVRATLARFLARTDLGAATRDARLASLGRLAREDPEASVRAAALRGWTGLGGGAAARALADFAREGPAAERAAAWSLLGDAPEAAGPAAALLRERGDDPRLHPLVVRALAAGPEGAADRERILVATGLWRAEPEARAAAALALERYARRLAQIGDPGRAVRELQRLEASGIRHPVLQEECARAALASARDPRAALAAADALERGKHAWEAPEDAELRRIRAARLAACARIGLEEPQAARERLDAARDRARALLRLRLDQAGVAGAQAHGNAWSELAQIELCEAVRVLAQGAEPDAADAVAALDAFHVAALRAQITALRAELSPADGLDRLLGAGDSAVELLLDAEPHGAWTPARQLAVRLALGRALAAAAPREALGFEPCERRGAAAADAHAGERRSLLMEVLRAVLDRAQERYARVALASERAGHERAGGPPARLRDAALEARLVLERAWGELAQAQGGEEEPLADVRVASWLCITTARALRDAGRGAEARALLARARDDLEASGAAQRWLWGLEMLAEIEAATGASFTDDEEPGKAEVELLRAVERLQALEDELVERRAPSRSIEIVRGQRASALVSLAVNANVRMRRPERALEYFERAWTLRQDDFMRALLACYRARSGRAEEARALLAATQPGPGTYYNIACTWALLGEREAALSMLRREILENHAAGGGRERQKAWARKDPDLASLRGDPAFLELVGE